MSERVHDEALPEPAYDRRHTERLHEVAQDWAWMGRGGDTKAQAAARVLLALAWTMTTADEEGLAALEHVARLYLSRLEVVDGVRRDPFVRAASTAYERLLAGVERQVTGTSDDAARHRAAQWFVILVRVVGFSVPELPQDDEAAVAFLVRALGRWRRKTFDDAREQAESWTRCMAEASGRRDAANAAKHRQQKPRSAK